MENIVVACTALLDGLTDYNDNPVTQFGWVYIDSSLEKEKRRMIGQIVKSWAHNHSPLLIQAGVHIYNVGSQKFLERMELKLSCAHIFRRI